MPDAVEEWRPIVGWEGMYSVSGLGRVRRDVVGRRNYPPPGTVLKPRRINSGYVMVSLYDGARQMTATIHSLVAAAFIGPRPDGHDVNHIDGGKTNNAAANLEYVRRPENMRHAFGIGLAQRGERHHVAKLTEAAVAEIRSLKGAVPQLDLARRFGVARTTISSIQSGRNWKVPA